MLLVSFITYVAIFFPRLRQLIAFLSGVFTHLAAAAKWKVGISPFPFDISQITMTFRHTRVCALH